MTSHSAKPPFRVLISAEGLIKHVTEQSYFTHSIHYSSVLLTLFVLFKHRWLAGGVCTHTGVGRKLSSALTSSEKYTTHRAVLVLSWQDLYHSSAFGPGGKKQVKINRTRVLLTELTWSSQKGEALQSHARARVTQLFFPLLSRLPLHAAAGSIFLIPNPEQLTWQIPSW